jgi:tetratricopeptide (TPR) repeat protein
MILARMRIPMLGGGLGVGLVFSFLLPVLNNPGTLAWAQDETIYERFEEVSSLRSQGRYDEAIEILRHVITQYPGSEEIMRRAYSDLVFTLLSKEDAPAATESAEEALYRFPDLVADPVYFPPKVNDVYDGLRVQMFGGLNVATRPDSCRVLLNGEFMGFSPLTLEYVRTGEYDLNVTKPGYREEVTTVRIEAGRPTSVPLSLQRERGKGWWLVRIGPAALIASLLLTIQLMEDEGAEPTPLPGPPPPPGQ